VRNGRLGWPSRVGRQLAASVSQQRNTAGHRRSATRRDDAEAQQCSSRGTSSNREHAVGVDLGMAKVRAS
jgi:hypothetical protein